MAVQLPLVCAHLEEAEVLPVMRARPEGAASLATCHTYGLITVRAEHVADDVLHSRYVSAMRRLSLPRDREDHDGKQDQGSAFTRYLLARLRDAGGKHGKSPRVEVRGPTDCGILELRDTRSKTSKSALRVEREPER